MDTGTASELCRVTVIAPDARIDVVLPADVPLGDLVPVLLRQAGENLADRGGWTLQRFGEVPLDLARPAVAASIRDGEILFLRPGQKSLPELAFDDVADAIATAHAERSRRWSDADTRRAGLVAAIAGLAVVAGLVLSSGPDWVMPAAVAGVIALVLVTTAAALSRAFGDAGAGVVVGTAGVAFATLAGALGFAADGVPVRGFDAACLLGASAAALVVAPVTAALVGDGLPTMAGIAAGALLAMTGAALELLGGLDAVEAAAVTVALTLLLMQPIPALSMRLADLPQPVVPLTPDEVRRDVSSVDGEDVIRRTLVADRYVTGLVGAAAAALAGASLLLSTRPEALESWTLAVVVAVTALRARVFTGRGQRLWLQAAAGTGALALVVSVAAGQDADGRLLAVVLPLVAACGLAVTAALRLPGRRVSPLLARAVDVVDALLVTAVLPLVLAVLGLYGHVRGLSG